MKKGFPINMRILRWLALYSLLASNSVEARKWTSADGSKTFEGDYIFYDPVSGMVEVFINGRVVKLHQEKFSAEDLEFLAGQIAPKDAPDPKPNQSTAPERKPEGSPPVANASIEDISEFVSGIRQGVGLKGLSLGVVKDGSVIAMGCDGRGGEGQERSLSLSDTYVIASCSKPMTATLAAILVKEGVLAWDTTLGKVFEDKLKRIDRRYSEVTLAQLLGHIGGAPEMEDFWRSGSLRDAVSFNGDNRGKRLRMLELEISSSPAEKVGRFEYSNAGFCFAASMMEEATGKTWEDLMQEKLFTPLDMKTARPTSPQDSNPSVMAPAAGVSCTIEDFAKFAAFHVRQFMNDKPADATGAKSDFDRIFQETESTGASLGWFTFSQSWLGGRVYCHGGTNPDFNTEIWLIPEKKMAVVAATSGGIQGSSGRRLERVVQSIISRFND